MELLARIHGLKAKCARWGQDAGAYPSVWGGPRSAIETHDAVMVRSRWHLAVLAMQMRPTITLTALPALAQAIGLIPTALTIRTMQIITRGLGTDSNGAITLTSVIGGLCAILNINLTAGPVVDSADAGYSCRSSSSFLTRCRRRCCYMLCSLRRPHRRSARRD